MSIEIAGPVAYLTASQSAVTFSQSNPGAGTYGSASAAAGTATPIAKLQNLLDLAFWGEDNRFPQNIEQQMAYYGLGKEALNKKASWLFGGGLLPGKITGYEDEGKKENFEPLDRTKYKEVYKFIEGRWFYRFMIEYLQDWSWFNNCFPEMILSNDGKTIAKMVHQESCDARFKQQNDQGYSDTVYLSKLWGATADQWAKFDPKKTMKGLYKNASDVALIDNKFLKKLDCIDMYDAVKSLEKIALKKKDDTGLKSAILPVNFPSPNKVYYQVPAWDGARLAGWIEIAVKVPALLKALFTKAFSIKYHIEIPETYFTDKYGVEAWMGMSEADQTAKKKELLQQMDAFLSGSENAHKSFISFFKIDPVGKKDYAQIKIQVIEDKSSIDKELISASAADLQFLAAAGIHPTIFGAGTVGTGQQRSGGSDIRESWITYNAGLNLERQVVLEPLYLVRDFNREIGNQKIWEEDIVFRFRDTILTTLDKGTGTEKKVS